MSLKRLFDIIIDKCSILTKSETPPMPTTEMQKTKASVSLSSNKHKSNDDNDEADKPTSSSYHPPLTRSRSASASGTTSRSNSSGSSSSGSSSSGSGSSSSGSSSSDSDASSSSSDTEASRASLRSRASRSSQKSTNSTKKANQPKETIPTKSAPSPQSQSKRSTAPSKVTSASATSSTTGPKKKTQAHDQSNSKTNTNIKPKPKPKPVLSGSVTNEKTISLSSSTPLLLKAKPTSTTQVIATSTKKAELKKPTKKAAASSTESESEGKPLATLKRPGANAKPKPSKQAPLTKANGKPPTTPVIKKAALVGVKKKTLPVNKKKLPTVTSRKKDLCLKTIFSPDNSSADESVLGGDKKKKLTKKMAPDAQKAAAVLKKKIRAAAAAATDSNAAAVYSSSVSATSSSVDSSSTSGSDSSSEEPEKRPANIENVDVSSPKSSTGSRGSRKGRPITRRQRGTVKSKTIPTTTVFSHISQSSGVTTSNQQQQVIIQSQSPYITRAWGDSDFSDDPSQGAVSLIRCPTKSSTNKAMRFPPIGSGGEEEYFERKCPFPACDSQGHLSGKFPTHSLLCTCPKYHDLTLEECKENASERARRDSERRKYYNPSQPHMKKPSKLSQDAKAWVTQIKELKEKPSKKMDGACSQYDESLWSDALAHAATRIELEQGEGISLRSIVIGRFEMACWCESPYAEPLCHSRRIFICEFCLKPLPSGTVLRRHCAKCVWRHPPGDEIYRKDRLSVWEVDGKSQKGYCQNLCLLAKSFLDHKTLYLDVDPFLFYVMTLQDSQGCHLVGYFSKEKNSFLNYNVSCILTLPPYQRQGFGRLLIDFSYLLTRVEQKVGSPEKPLSDLGLISYRSYWKDAVLRRMCACATREMNVKDLSIELGVTSADLISTLQFLGMLKYWKGKHLVLKKQDVLEEYLERVRRRGETRQIEPSCLRWRPYQPPVDQSSS